MEELIARHFPEKATFEPALASLKRRCRMRDIELKPLVAVAWPHKPPAKANHLVDLSCTGLLLESSSDTHEDANILKVSLEIMLIV